MSAYSKGIIGVTAIAGVVVFVVALLLREKVPTCQEALTKLQSQYQDCEMVGPVILKGIDSQHIGGLFYCNGPDTKRGIALAPEDEATGIRLLLEQGGSIVGKCDNDTDINYQILTREDKIQGIPTNSN